MRITTALCFTAGALSAACGNNPQPESPAPQAATPDTTMMRGVQDSIAAVNRARTDSVERARQATARAAADSVSRAQVAAEAAARQATSAATAKSAELRQVLGESIYFDLGHSRIRVDGGSALDRKVAILNANPEVRLQITGATDDRGSDAYNKALGDRRAKAVKKYLVEKGIDAARLSEMSSGEKTPRESGTSEEAWAKNRRVEFSIVSVDRPLVME